MSHKFLDQLSLKSLLSPVTEEEFLKNHWEKLPLFIPRGNPDYYGDLLTLEDFDHHISSAPASIKSAEAKSKKNTRYQGNTGSVMQIVNAEMREGITLVLDQLQEREPKLRLLCKVLEQQLGYRFQTNCYLTPPNGAGFTPHWDNHDVFVLQVFGSKHWKVERTRRRLPGKTEGMSESEGREIRPGADSLTLHQGDALYIPRGFVHAAECGSEPSLHITLGLNVYTWEDLLHAAIKGIVHDDEGLRLALPPGFLRDNRDALVKGVMNALQKGANAAYIGRVVDRFKDELTTRFPLDMSGQITAFIKGTPLTIRDTVGPRRGIVFTAKTEGDVVRLNFGGQTFTFPGFFAEALDYALNTASFPIAAIAGELADEEKIVFVERLIQEGLIVRK